MKTGDENQEKIAFLKFNLFPPLIRKSITEDLSFNKQHDLLIDADIIFNNKFVFRRSTLFNAIRKALSSDSKIMVLDKEKRRWSLLNINENKKEPHLVLHNKQNDIMLSDYSAFSMKKSIRLNAFKKAARKFNLPC